MLVTTFLIVLICVNEYSLFSLPRNKIDSITSHGEYNMSYGIDGPNKKPVKEGLTSIETYPWLGLLIYPFGSAKLSTTAVVLITRDIVLATALDIDYFPKNNFRARSRVIMGTNCNGPFIRIREYTFHPDFTRNTYSTIALVQLDTVKYNIKVFPISPPPAQFAKVDEIYAMSITNDCYNSSMVMVYKIEHVANDECRYFYRRAGLDLRSLWPTHVACARASHGGHCIWRSGTVLVIWDDGQWKLLGFGTYGPGCESPARFLDYGMHYHWVKRSLEGIGQPTITRISTYNVILRRTTSNIRRFGPCDSEEVQSEIFTNKTHFNPPYPMDDDLDELGYTGTIAFNITLLDNVDYHCIILRAWNRNNAKSAPIISVRPWCTIPKLYCAGFDIHNVFYFVEIHYKHRCTLKINAYGTEVKIIKTKFSMMYNNKEWVESYKSVLNTTLITT